MTYSHCHNSPWGIHGNDLQSGWLLKHWRVPLAVAAGWASGVHDNVHVNVDDSTMLRSTYSQYQVRIVPFIQCIACPPQVHICGITITMINWSMHASYHYDCFATGVVDPHLLFGLEFDRDSLRLRLWSELANLEQARCRLNRLYQLSSMDSVPPLIVWQCRTDDSRSGVWYYLCQTFGSACVRAG